MRLIIDIGNTNIKIALFDNNILLKKFIYDAKKKIQLQSLSIDFSKIKHVFFCGANRYLQQEFDNIIDHYNFSLIMWKDIKKDMLEFTYNQKKIGFDRLGLVIGAVYIYEKFSNHLVIDIGTCITYDFVSNRYYKGGQISPGMSMRLKALHKFTKTLPQVEFSMPKNLIGKSTKESIRSGIFFGVYNEIMSTIECYKNMCCNLNIIITGGDSIHFQKRIKNVIFDDNLLMKGLNLMLNYNVKK